MIFLYIDGAEIPVSEERAMQAVKDGRWYECRASHTFGRTSPYHGEEVRVFHREYKVPTKSITEASK